MKWDDIKDKPREIDQLIAENVFNPIGGDIEFDNRNSQFYTYYSQENERFYKVFPYSTNIADAWEVVEKMCFNHWFEMNNNDTFKFIFNDYEVEEKTAPLAICHAALLTLDVLEE